MTQTTKENISRIVANGIEAGIGREKMADEILQEYEIQTRSRARLIADQETVMTLETGHYDMMQKSGATTKTWHHRPQKNPRDGSNGGPNHVKMDGETVPIDARFSNGLRYPCDPEGLHAKPSNAGATSTTTDKGGRESGIHARRCSSCCTDHRH